MEKKKLKSKWRAEKRRDGLETVPSVLPTSTVTDDEESASRSEGGAEEFHGFGGAANEDDHAESSSSHSDEPLQPATRPGPTRTQDRKGKQNLVAPNKDEPEPPSLRELYRQAYSKESLHTYKSDSFKKRHSSGDRGRGRGRGGGGRGGGTTGRGQPNMKLRMNAMLEKIKRDIAS